MFRCCSLETSRPRLLPQSLKDCFIHLCFKKRNVSSFKWEWQLLGSRNQSGDKYWGSKITETKTHLQGLLRWSNKEEVIFAAREDELWVRDLFHQGGEIFVSVSWLLLPGMWFQLTITSFSTAKQSSEMMLDVLTSMGAIWDAEHLEHWRALLWRQTGWWWGGTV